jgi:hypothetical protein
LRRDERRNYWERVQVLYQAYYAYEEVLATFADRARTPNSMLSKMEAIAGLLARERVELKRIPERRRLDTKKAFERPPRAAQPTTRAGQVFVSYNPADLAIVQKVVERLTADGIDVWIDRTDLRPGDNWQEAISSAIRATGVVLYFVGTTEISKWREQEVALALAQGIRVIPVMLDDASFESLPPRLRMVTAAVVNTSDKSSLEEAIARLSRAVGSFLSSHREDAASPFDPDDPNRGRWGLDAIRNGRELSASVRDITDDYFEVTLVVQSVGPTPLEGEVEFHLHPTFAKPVQTVPVVDGRAVLSVPCWGAFTVGAVADGGRTTLELDLAADSSFPKTFTER